jgi:hypothetical protein
MFGSDADPDPTFQFDADPDPTTHFFPNLYPPMLQTGPLRLPPFHFEADPDPAFHFDTDPASQNNESMRIRIRNTVTQTD